MMFFRFLLSLSFAIAISTTLSTTFAADEIAIGTKGPDFKATGVDGKEYSLDSVKGAKVTVLAFTCNRCPVAIGYEDRFIDFQKKYGSKDVKFIAINVNSSEDLAAMKQRAEEKGMTYPYAYDATGDSARAYGARTTPHVFVLDSEGKVAYRGSFDDKQKDPTKHYVANAVTSLLEGKTPEVQTTKSFGCGIKPNKQ